MPWVCRGVGTNGAASPVMPPAEKETTQARHHYHNPLPARIALSQSAMKALRKARHMGRATNRYSFELKDIELVSGLPSNLSATGLVCQMARGPKLTTTKEVELTQDMKEQGGGVVFPSKLNFVATLFASKTGKTTGFSDKRYRVSILALKPTFGTSKKHLKEIAACEVNISQYALTEQSTPLSLQLDRRAHDGLPLTLNATITARPVKPGQDDDDEDDSMSVASGLTGFDAAREVPSEAPSDPAHLEQDLQGFDLAQSRENLFKKTPRLRPEADDEDAAAAEAARRAAAEIEAEFGAAPSRAADGDAAGSPPPQASSSNPFEDRAAPRTSNAGVDEHAVTAAAAAFAAAAEEEDEADGADDDDEDESDEMTISDPEDDDDEFVEGAAARKISLRKKAAGVGVGGGGGGGNTSGAADAPGVASSDAAAASAAAAAAAAARQQQIDREELGKTREELSYAREQLRRATEEAAASAALAEERRLRVAEAERGWSATQREVANLKAEVEALEAERNGLAERLRAAEEARLAASAAASGDADAAAAAKAAADEAAYLTIPPTP